MKKLLVVLASLVFATGIFAHEAGTTQLSIVGNVGLGLTSGDLNEIFGSLEADGEVPENPLEGATGFSSGVALSYSIGVQAGYFLSDTIAIMFGVGYTNRPVMMADADNTDYGIKISQGFVDLSAGLRGYMSGIFLGAGFTYGIKVGDRKIYEVWDGEDFDTGYIAEIFEIENSESKNNASLYFEAGFAFLVLDDVSLDLGLKFNLGLVNTIDIEEMGTTIMKVKPHSLDLTIGLSFLF